MELDEVIRCTGTCRYFRTDPVDDDVLRNVLDAGRFAAQGGNRQPVRYIVVRDAAGKALLQDRYLEPWRAYIKGVEEGRIPIGGEKAQKAVSDADHMARHLHEVPVLVIVCARLADLTTPDAALDRVGIVGGASIYPGVQNILLTARQTGLGASITTLAISSEPALREPFGIPDDVAIAAVLALGWPERPLLRKLTRRPLEEVVYRERYGEPLFGAGVHQ
jgi:nitroreductase